jgi:WD40 repeat protein
MITALAFQNHEDLFQCLAVGLVDGAIIILDLILGVERSFLEKHPREITAMAFWEDKVLISGSLDGRVNIQELDSLSE